jgi:flagellin-specific chaperone FliS
MNRSKYFNIIEEKLTHLVVRIGARGRLNILDLNLHSENFYRDFVNLLFGWNLENLNVIQQNAAGIDLIDDTNKLVVQVSATATKQKVESALGKDISKYSDYSFKFIPIILDARNLKNKTFSNPHDLEFSPTDDIYDIADILKIINDMAIDPLEKVYEFIKKELKSEANLEKVESNLTTIIKILSKEDWEVDLLSPEVEPFDIENKITYNQLDSARGLIDDFKIHYYRIDKIYSDFDKQGVNKSLSILNGIRSEYLQMSNSTDSPDQCFFSIIEKVIKKIRASANYIPIPDEELGLCVQILVVDSFIRCKIFKNPIGDANACS